MSSQTTGRDDKTTEVSFRDLLREPLRNGIYKPKKFHGRGVKVVNMKELFAYDRIHDQPEELLELTPDEASRFSLLDGDLLFARRSFVLEGSGKCSIVVRPKSEIVFESSMIRARIDENVADPGFLYYYFRAPQGRALMASIASRTAVSGITGSNLAGLRLAVPAISVQRRVAKVLVSFDELLENNEQRIEALEQIAKAIHREWFVHFRFPGHQDVSFAETQAGSIPDTWRRGCVDDLVALEKKTVHPHDIDPATPAIGLEHIPRRRITLGRWGLASELGSRKSVFETGDILFGKIRPYFHKVSVAPVSGICSTDALVLRPLEDHWGQAVMTAASDEFVSYATQTSNGTKMPRADWNVIKGFEVPIPPVELSRRFTQVIKDQLDMAKRLMDQNRVLTATRDLLLPKLVSGQIDLSGVDLDVPPNGKVA